MYKEFIIIFSLVIVHELGHLLLAKILKWRIDKIAIYPFGGCVFFNESINKPIYQELLILLFGPITQILFFLLITLLFNNNAITYRNFILFKSYNYTLLFFNLLPIYPLDGGKLLNLICNWLLPYKKGNKLVIIFSYILISFFIIYTMEINYILMGIFLITEITFYLKKQDYLFNKFLLERYLGFYHFKRLKIISKKNNMYKERRHLFKIDNKFITEKDYLNKRYYKGEDL